jgi:hypothetical protein
MTITLPDELKDELERKATAAGFGSVLDYFLHLAAHDQLPKDDAAANDGPPHLTPRNRAELAAMLEAGANSGPTIPDSPEFWAERRRVLAERMARRKGGAT